MNALIVIGLCALSANAQFISGVLPYSYNPNLLHSAAFTPAVAGPVTYASAAHVAYTTAAVAPLVAPTTRTSQFHAQDELGQYNFGYSGGPSSRNEVRDAFGVVRGSYNYIDADGKLQTQSYIADALGFRVAATNLPVAPKAVDAPALEPVQETPEVAAARATFQKAFDEAASAAAAAHDTSARRKRSVGSVANHSAVSPLRFSYGSNAVHPYNFPYTTPSLTYTSSHAVAPAVTYASAAPTVTYAASPVAYTTAAVAPLVVPTTRTSQFHAQDELGQYNFGYSGGPSSRNEVRDAFGVVRGSYNYIDADGKLQTQSYVADALGFRVAATNLPVAPKAADAPILASPEPVEETAEVAAARAAHQKAYDEAASAASAAPDMSARRKRSVGSVAIHSAVSPLRFSYGFNTVHPYSFPYTAPALTYTASHAVAPAVTYAAAAPAVTYAAAAAPAVTYAAGHAVTPVTYSAAAPAVAATHDAQLLRVENNPGHAVSYRVY